MRPFDQPSELSVEQRLRERCRVLDGSGSTLITCAQTGRNAFLMELDPLYCDVIVKRWEDLTGQQGARIAPDNDKDVSTEKVRGRRRA